MNTYRSAGAAAWLAFGMAALPMAASAQFAVTAQQGSVKVDNIVQESQALTPLNLLVNESGATAGLKTFISANGIGIETAAGLPMGLPPTATEYYSQVRPAVAINVDITFNVLEDTPVVLGDIPSFQSYSNWLSFLSLSKANDDGTWTGVNYFTVAALTAGQWRLRAISFPASPGYLAVGRFSITAVPEPGSLAMMGLGLIALSWRARKPRH